MTYRLRMTLEALRAVADSQPGASGFAVFPGGVCRGDADVELLLADWRRQRAGSVRSLNQTAVGLGLRLLEDLVAGRGEGSTWLRLEFDADGVPRLERPHRPADARCPVCAVAGLGDAVLSVLPDVFRRATEFGGAARRT